MINPTNPSHVQVIQNPSSSITADRSSSVTADISPKLDVTNKVLILLRYVDMPSPRAVLLCFVIELLLFDAG